MRTNIGTFDRTVRLMAGVILLSLTVAGPHTMWGLLGLLPITTALVGFCPLYRLLRISTSRPPAQP